jgi:hypothetical protein
MIINLILMGLLWTAFGFVLFAIIYDNLHITGEASFDNVLLPNKLYENTKLNWFGTILLWLLLNFLVLYISIGYWFCKLFTVGRK